MRKSFQIIGIIAIMISITACGKQTQAETTTPTTVPTSVSKDLADQASREVEELEELEANGAVVYSETTGDILHVYSESEQQVNKEFIESIKQDAVDGTLTEDMINNYMDSWFDFLSEGDREELRKELILLLPKEEAPQVTAPAQETKAVPETQPQKQEQPTQPAPQPTQPAPQPTEPVVPETPSPTQPAPQPTQTYEPGSTVTDANGVTVEIIDFSDDQSLSPEQYKAINEVEFN